MTIKYIGNLDVTICHDSDDSQLSNSADESQIMNSADELDEPMTEIDNFEESDRIQTTATVQLHNTEVSWIF